MTKFRGLDGLRGISILIVVADHILHNVPTYNSYFIGRIGVNIFFVISGFLITTLLLKEKAKYGQISLQGFYIRRALRILPVVYLFLISLVILHELYDLYITRRSFMYSFLFLRNMPLPHKDWYTTHLWSLAIEEQFYVLFPFLFVVFRRPALKTILIMAILLLPLLSLIYLKRIDIEQFHFNRAGRVALAVLVHLFRRGTVLILIGCLAAILFFERNRIIRIIHEKAPNYASIVLFIVGITFCIPGLPLYSFYSEVPFGICMAMAIILNLKDSSSFGKALEWEPLKQLGFFSYNIYIWQQLFTHQQPWGGNLFLNLAAMVILSYISFQFYEKKFLHLKDRFKRV